MVGKVSSRLGAVSRVVRFPLVVFLVGWMRVWLVRCYVLYDGRCKKSTFMASVLLQRIDPGYTM